MPEHFILGLGDPFSLSSLLAALVYLSIAFIAVLELLVTIWAIAELRTRLHRLRQQRRQQGDFTPTGPPQSPGQQIRRTRRFHYWPDDHTFS